MQQFLSFCLSIDGSFKSLPANVSHVLYYIRDLFESDIKYASIASKICIISYYHKLLKLSDPTCDYIVKRALQGYKKIAVKSQSKIPISMQMLCNMLSKCELLSLAPYYVKLFRAILSVGFFALLRPGEITASNNTLDIENVFMQDQCIVLDFQKYKHSKTTPNCIAIAKSGGPCCPHFHLGKFLLVRGSGPGPLFSLPDNSPLPYKTLTDWFKLVTSLCNFPAKLSLHSLQVGGATHAALIGKTEAQIQRFGRWTGQGFNAYLQFNSTTVM